jgi:Domain of unknown function (DUF6963)
MTIGIAVSGPHAAKAALAALRAVEAVGRGAIGGFVSMAAIGDGQLLTACTQNGGADALFPDGLPDDMANVPLVVLMSSGPDRPEPLIQFTPGDPDVGLMTGHRLPNMPGEDGHPPNLVALNAMKAGATPEAAVAMALAANQNADAGLIAMDLNGTIALGNSTAVSQRDDLGEALAEHDRTGLRIGILHNSIHPHKALAALAVAAAQDAVSPMDCCTGEADIVGRVVSIGEKRALHIDPSGKLVAITSDDRKWLSDFWEGSVVQRGDPVLTSGRVSGKVVREVYCRLEGGRIVGSRGGSSVSWKSDE